MREDQIQKLNELSNQEFEKLIMAAISILSSSKGTYSNDVVDGLSSDLQIPAALVIERLQDITSVLNDALRKSHNHSLFKTYILNLGINEGKAALLSEQWEANTTALSQNAFLQTLSVNQLVDMEWKFGVSAASSEVDKLGNTFLQLKLTIRNGNHLEPVYFELTLSQFYTFLHEMEKARASMDVLI